MKGKLIVIEGANGSGKETQAKLLLKRLRKESYNAEMIDFPQYNSYYGKIIGRYLKGEFGDIDTISPYIGALPYALDRKNSRDKILKWIKQGKVIIANRYVPSQAFQAAKIKNRNEQEKFLKWVQELEYKTNKMPKPAKVVYFDVPVRIGQKLVMKKKIRGYLGKKAKDIHERNTKFLERTESIYRKMARKNKWIVINCIKKKEIMPIKEIHEILWKKLGF